MENKPIIVEAYKCPETGKVFTDRAKYEKFVEHRAIAKKHRDEAIAFKQSFNDKFKSAASVYQILDLLQEFFTKNKTFRQKNGRPVDSVTVVLPGHPTIKIESEFLILNEVMIQIPHTDILYKGALIHREGFDEIINNCIDSILIKDKSKYTKNKDESKFVFSMMIHLEAIPCIIERVKNYDSLLLEKEQWEKEIGEATTLAIKMSDELLLGKDRLLSMNELQAQIHKFDIEIDALTQRRANALGQLTDMKNKRLTDIDEAYKRISLDTPFEKQKEIEEIPAKDQIVYRMIRNLIKTNC